MNNFLYVVSYLSFLLLLGVLFRSKIKVFQNLFIPSSVIGGFAGLLLNPSIFPIWKNIIKIEWYNYLKVIPGILIIPIIVSIPLGLNITKGIKKDSINMGLILFIVTFFQLCIGYFVNYIYVTFFNGNIYKTFGAELNAGFAGGHGTAGMIGRSVKELNVDYWMLAQGIATTIATVGLILGVVFGIYLINIGCRNGVTEKLKDPSSISEELKKGYEKNINKQDSFGRETMLTTSIDTLAYHCSIVFTICGISIGLINFFKINKIPILSKLSAWSLGMILMFFIWNIMKKLDLEWSIDSRVKSKLTGMFTEYAIVAAIATMPIVTIFKYIVPIFLILILGFFGTWKIIFILSKRYFKNNYYYERGLALLGTSTGVFLTGLLLLRICDPKLETPVLRDYTLGFSLTALLGPILIGLCITLSFQYTAVICIILMGVLFLIGIIIIEYFNRKMSRG